MARRFHPRSATGENLRIIARSVPWKLFLLLPILLAIAIPTFIYGARIGGNILPSLTNNFFNISAPAPAATPTPHPAFQTILPQAGSIRYTVQQGDNCDAILAFQMRMNDAGQVFSDVKPNTVKALNQVMGHDCHTIQPGMTLYLSPHYPLVALGGVILKIDAATPQQVVPTPLINVPAQQYSVDCSDGCLLTVRIASQVQVHLTVRTTLTLKVGSWVWAQAMLARKAIPGFPDYPYADPAGSLNDMRLSACDLQIDQTHDDNGISCTRLTPNTIRDDHGAWLLGVVGTSSLDHWRYPLHQPPNTRVLLWLTYQNGHLVFQKGNPVYKYDEASQLYIPT